jgi:hypothetical protein
MARQLHTEDATFWVAETDLPEIPEPDEAVSYQLRELTTSKWREIRKLNTTMKPNKQTRTMEPVLNDEGFSDDLVDYVIIGWKGIVDRGAEAPCTRETKQRLDGPIKSALVGRAGLTQIVREPEIKAESFRATADVG